MTILGVLKVIHNDNERLTKIIEHFGCDSGTIHRLDANTQMLCLKASGPGMPPTVLEKIEHIPIGKGMAGLAVERNKPINSCNIQTDASGDVNPGAKATGLHGSIVVPIHDAKGNAVGSLGIATKEDRMFTDEEIEELDKCGRVIAIA